MQLLEHLEKFQSSFYPLVLTIGNFDGMHRGHRAVLQKVHQLVGTEGQAIVMTFSNHPSTVLRADQPTLLICHLAHKLRLIESYPVDTLILLPFTRYLAQHSAASFVERVRQFIPFSHLVLGHDATLGRDRQGSRFIMQGLGEEWGFHVHYLEEYRFEGHPVSSTRIREAIQQADFELVSDLLGRPHSISGLVIAGKGKGKEIGYPTANLDVTGLCLPPLGVYAIDVIIKEKTYLGIANLGVAPTVKENALPVLEVHLFDWSDSLYDESIEVIFKQMIRPERHFDSIEQLREQIEQDIQKAKHIL